MNLHVGDRDVSGDGEVWNPQVLYVCVFKQLLNDVVEATAGHHGTVRPGQVHHQPPLLTHLQTEAPGLHSHLGDVSLLSPKSSHTGANTDPSYSVNGYTSLQN